jgi:molybdopterin synthase catalytic subunit
MATSSRAVGRIEAEAPIWKQEVEGERVERVKGSWPPTT